MNITIKLTLTLLTLITLTACNDSTTGAQNPNKHGLLNSTPKAIPQTIQTKEDSSIDITLKATDDDNDTLGYKITKQPNSGTLEGKAPNITYTPNRDYNGKDSFTFIANDGLEDSNEAVVNIEIAPVADLKELKLSIDKKVLNRDTNTSYTIEPIFDKGEIPKELQTKIDNIALESDIKDSIKIDKTTSTITVIKDGNLTIQAKIDNITSNKEILNVYWEVNGHRLPPEPDPKINNSTLLGIDSNNNGVRDDVERWIYETYKDKHPIYAAIGMEAAKSYQLSLMGAGYWEEAHKLISDVIGCESYYMYDADEFKDPLLVNRDEDPSDDGLLHMMMNTSERINTYADYDHSLSGKVYKGTWPSEDKQSCPASIKEVLK